MTVIQKENKEDVEVKPYDVIEAWPEPVDSSLFDEIVADIRKHLHITEDNAIKAAFWSAHTHMFSQFEHTPRLVITAPTSACGKTVLKQVIHAMCDKAKDTDSMTGAALIRYAARGDMTFLWDEADQTFSQRNTDTGVTKAINGGWQQGGSVDLCVGDNSEPTQMKTHCAACLVGIKLDSKLPRPTLERSIVLYMEKAKMGSKRFRRKHQLPIFQEHGRKLRRWIDDNQEAIAGTEPELIEEVDDRAMDLWESLIQIAEVASPEWGKKIRGLVVRDSRLDDDAIEKRLLRDIRRIHDELQPLSELPEGPPGRWITNKGIQPERLAVELGGLSDVDDSSERFWATFNKPRPGYGDDENQTRVKGSLITKTLKNVYVEKKTIRFGTGENDVFKGLEWQKLLTAQSIYAPIKEEESVAEYVPGADEEGEDEIPF